MFRLAVALAASTLVAGCGVAIPQFGGPVPTPGHVSLNDLPVPAYVCAAVDDTSTVATFRSSLIDYVECARQSWTPALQAIGRRAPDPAVFVEATDAPSACTGLLTDDEVGMYCRLDGSLVFSDDLRWMADDGDLIAARVAFHEYAHAVQHELGMVLDAPSGSSTRRIELQATCWSAMLLRTLDGLQVTDEVRQYLADDVGSVGDADHGTSESRRRWTLIGFDATSMAACDTSKAPESHVS
nr:hypothetical protein [Propionicimonas sp.]